MEFADQLVAQGFQLGSHTVSHPILSRLSEPELRSELETSKLMLEKEIGRPVTSLAYPNGGDQDFNESVLRATQEAGYHGAFAVGDRLQRAGDSALAIRRMIIPGHRPETVFRFLASGLRDSLA